MNTAYFLSLIIAFIAALAFAYPVMTNPDVSDAPAAPEKMGDTPVPVVMDQNSNTQTSFGNLRHFPIVQRDQKDGDGNDAADSDPVFRGRIGGFKQKDGVSPINIDNIVGKK
ncbi:hypothetical protein DFJ77DRAFT_444328 [Powellomyces hirtus]|nr:hypothetical protein DFJ77DRAFT_444328 [Powellomyces hirtus]